MTLLGWLLWLGCADLRLTPVDVCDGVDNDGDGRVDEGYDADGDGWAGCDAPGFDCDDGDDGVHPGAAEACDGKDGDCDGVLPDWERDDDGDGVLRCLGDCDDADSVADLDDADFDGWTSCGGDCDDGDATVHPGVREVCDGVDQDCDGALGPDELDRDGDGASVCDGDCDDVDGARNVADLDGDGWSTCDELPDCDDTDAGVAPFTEEVCDGVDQDCDGETDEDGIGATTWYADADGDTHGDPGDALVACDPPEGRVPSDTDCDDQDYFIRPDAIERCDGVDEDCDDVVDDGLPTFTTHPDRDFDARGDADTEAIGCAPAPGWIVDGTDCDDADPAVTDAPAWYADADGDGFGDPAGERVACEAPVGHVAAAGDCDDTDALRAPGADEVCDGVDQDCDDRVDEDARDAPEWFVDADGDGYGDGSPLAACAGPAGHAAIDGDCDDEDGAVSPLGVETCDGVDQDCDGRVDEGEPADGGRWYLDTDGDLHGDPTVEVRACEPPARFVAAADDCDDLDGAIHPGAPEACDGVDEDCDGRFDDGGFCGVGDLSDETLLSGGAAGDAAGTMLAGGWDLDGDGVGELVVGAPGAGEGGVVYVFTSLPTGPDLGSADAHILAPAGAELGADGASGGAGDVDGDGVDDLVLGAPGEDTHGAGAGAVYVVLGGAWSGPIDTRLPGVLPFLGDIPGARAGTAVAAPGDLDGDGVADVLVGAPASGPGTAWVLYGGTHPGGVLSSTADASFVGEADGDRAGTAVAIVGDVDGDGRDDVAVAAPGAELGAGTVAVWSGTPPTGDQTLSSATLLLHGDAGMAGAERIAPADPDGNGVAGLLVSACAYDDTRGGEGRIALWHDLPAAGHVDFADADLRVTGSAAGDATCAARVVPDLDGDGATELWLGAAGADGGAGLAALFYGLGVGAVGLSDADAAWRGPSAGDGAGSSVSWLGDLDGDGRDELAVGAPGLDGAGADAGGVYLLWGRP